MDPERLEGPRVLTVDLAALTEEHADPRPVAWTDPDPRLTWIGSWGGTALGLALLAREVRALPQERVPDAEAPLVLAVGACVRQALPTAARVSVLSRAPLTGRLSEGQVGGELGPRLASSCDALVLRGRTSLPGAVLRIDAAGGAALASFPALVGKDPVATWRTLTDALGPGAVLTIGAGGEQGIPYACLASGGERPSFVGRGGLGAVFGRLGLKALVVSGEPSGFQGDPVARDELVAALAASPRLAERAAGGTLELYDAFAARGDLRARNYAETLAPEEGHALSAEARERGTDRKGCRGCPTPCGWVFERSDGVRMGAHFSASYALGTNLGLASFDDALHLLAACDRFGLDAKEVGAVLALEATARERGRAPGPPTWGDRDRLAARIEAIATGGADAEPLRAGASALAREMGLVDELTASRGQAARPEANEASLLGQLVSIGGADPMRSFPFLIGSAGRERLERLCTDLGTLPSGAEDPGLPAGKGRLVFWHENLVSAVDASGFCAFSTAGLLADGLADLDRLAGWIAPPALRAPRDPSWKALEPGRRLLAAGANLVLLRHEIDDAWGAPLGELPAWARQRLDAPGMLAEYREWRGLDAAGSPTAESRERLGTPDLLPPVRSSARRRPAGTSAPTPRAPGRVTLQAMGTLAERLGARAGIELELPATVREVLRSAAANDALLERSLFDGEQPIPAVWRDGHRLEPDAAVRDGDVLELVTAISGG